MARRYRYGALRRLLNRFYRGRGPARARPWVRPAPDRGGPAHRRAAHHPGPPDRGRGRALAGRAVRRGRLGPQPAGRGRGTLERGAHREDVGAVEVGPEEAAPVLQRYIADVPITRPYFDVSADSPLEAIAAEAGRHPVFRLTPPGGGG